MLPVTLSKLCSRRCGAFNSRNKEFKTMIDILCYTMHSLVIIHLICYEYSCRRILRHQRPMFTDSTIISIAIIGERRRVALEDDLVHMLIALDAPN